MKVQIQKLHPDAQIPKRGSELAGGWDVTVTEIVEKEPGFIICKLGFALQPPVDHKVTLVPRSNLTGTSWYIPNSPGLGDPDYRGEYQIRFRATPTDFIFQPGVIRQMTYPEFPYKVGDRVAQMYIEQIILIEFEEVEELSETVRGAGGFGHTGNK